MKASITIKTLVAIMMSAPLLHAAFADELVNPIKCQTMNGERAMTITSQGVAFVETDNSLGRSISSESALSIAAHTSKIGNGFTKVLNFEGKTHKIHIENLDSFNEVDDYMTIISPQGHELTYPLKCSK